MDDKEKEIRNEEMKEKDKFVQKNPTNSIHTHVSGVKKNVLRKLSFTFLFFFLFLFLSPSPIKLLWSMHIKCGHNSSFLLCVDFCAKIFQDHVKDNHHVLKNKKSKIDTQYVDLDVAFILVHKFENFELIKWFV